MRLLCPGSLQSVFASSEPVPSSRWLHNASAFLLPLLAIIYASSLSASAQNASFAGYQSSQNVVVSSVLSSPHQIAVDASGDVFIADTGNNRIVEEAISGGTTSQVVIPSSSLSGPQGVAVDAAGNVYIADTGNGRVLMETPSGGSYTEKVVYNTTGRTPVSLAIDQSGSVYVADQALEQLIKETPSGGSYSETTISWSYSGSGQIESVAVDANGNVYIGNTGSNPIIVAIPSGSSYTIAAESMSSPYFYSPQGMTVDAQGNLYIANGSPSEIVKETPYKSPSYSYTRQTLADINLNNPSGIAVDTNGNIYVADTGNGRVVKDVPGYGSFGQVNVATTSSTMSVIFQFVASSGTISAPHVLTQGTTGLDFADAGTGTCTTNGTSHVYSPGDRCTVDVVFTPRNAGPRYGAVQLSSSTGTLLATGYIQGIGVGPQLSFSPGTQTQLSFSSVSNPYGIAADGAGNLYLAEAVSAYSPANAVVKETWNGSSYTQSTVATGLAYPTGVAVDGAGTVYIADQDAGSIIAAVPTSSGYSVTTLLSGIGQIEGIAVDGTGNLYFVSNATGVVKETNLSPYGYGQSTIARSVFGSGIAVDLAGDLYVADGSSQIYKETASGLTYTQSTIVTGLNGPHGIAVDAEGNLYVASTFGGTVLKETPSSGSWVQSTLASGTNDPIGVAIDGAGNVYFSSDAGNGVWELNLSSPPALYFNATPVGQTSSNSPQTVTITNSGTAALTLPVPGTGTNPSISAGFTLSDSAPSACPQVDSAAAGPGTLAAGTSCALAVSFSPSGVGTFSGSLVLTNNNLNAAAPSYTTQTITLSGSGIQATPTITWAAPAAITYGTALSTAQLNATASVPGTFTYSPAAGTILAAGTQTLSVTFTPADSADYTTATATVRLTVNQAGFAITWAAPAAITYGTALSATQLNATASVPGSFSYSPAASTILAAGTQTLTATFTPTDTVDYSTATASVFLTVNQAIPTITWATPTAITYGTALGATQLDATASVPGSFAYTPASGTVLGAGSHALVVTFTPSDARDYSNATATVSIQVNQAGPSITWAVPAPISYGTALGAAQLNASSTVAGTFAYTPAAGAVLGVGAQTLKTSLTPTDAADYTSATASTSLTVHQATPAILLAASSNSTFLSDPVTFTATLAPASGAASGTAAPTGSVSFFDGTTQLAVVLLNSGSATYITTALSASTHPITALYSGDGNYVAAASATLNEVIEDFTLTVGGSTSATTSPGGQAVYTLILSPPSGATFPAAINLAVAGLPAGGTATLSPVSIPAGAGATTVTLTISVPNALAMAIPPRSGSRSVPIYALALLFLPCALIHRKHLWRRGKIVWMLVVSLGGAALLTGLGGCGGGGGGHQSPQPQTYVLTVSATSGTLSNTTTLSLTVQ